MAFYDELQVLAGDILSEFNQGSSGEMVITSTPAANEWDMPSEATLETTLDAVARGVSSQYIDGVQIVSTDLQMTVSAIGWSPSAGMNIKIDGAAVTVLRFDAIPAMGTAVAWRVFVRR